MIVTFKQNVLHRMKNGVEVLHRAGSTLDHPEAAALVASGSAEAQKAAAPTAAPKPAAATPAAPAAPAADAAKT